MTNETSDRAAKDEEDRSFELESNRDQRTCEI